MLGFEAPIPTLAFDPEQYVEDTWSPVFIAFLTVILCAAVLVLLMRWMVGLLFWVFAIALHTFLITSKYSIAYPKFLTSIRVKLKIIIQSYSKQLLSWHHEHICILSQSLSMRRHICWASASSRFCQL